MNVNSPGPSFGSLSSPEDEDEPTKFRFADLPADTAIDDLVRQAKLRWRIERDDLELEPELGLGHYEGRCWRGFHHHASLRIAAYGFLVAERPMFSPKGDGAKPRFRLPVRPKTPQQPPSGQNVASPDPSPLCVGASPSNAPSKCPDVHAANEVSIQRYNDVYDTAGLRNA
jgi:hypothetical protein